MISLAYDRPDTRGLGEECIATLRPHVRAAVEDSVLDLLARLKRKIGGAGRGRRYEAGRVFFMRGGKLFSFVSTKKGYGRQGNHTASAPGDPPARDTGRYVNSWQHLIVDDADFISAGIYSPMWEKLGKWLEFGTRRMKPRPHVGPVTDEWQSAAERRLEQI